MPPRRQSFVRLTRALLACLVVLVAFEPPAPRVELVRPVAVVASVVAPTRARSVRRAEPSRAVPMRSLATVDEPLVDARPRAPLLPVRRLYVELCSLLC